VLVAVAHKRVVLEELHEGGGGEIQDPAQGRRPDGPRQRQQVVVAKPGPRAQPRQQIANRHRRVARQFAGAGVEPQDVAQHHEEARICRVAPLGKDRGNIAQPILQPPALDRDAKAHVAFRQRHLHPFEQGGQVRIVRAVEHDEAGIDWLVTAPAGDDCARVPAQAALGLEKNHVVLSRQKMRCCHPRYARANYRNPSWRGHTRLKWHKLLHAVPARGALWRHCFYLTSTHERAKRITTRKCDPAWGVRRNWYMFDATGPADFSDASPPWPAYAGRQGRRLDRRRRDHVAQAETDGAKWVVHLKQVRDDQDTAAFAALFQHFAPRIKAFLMKGGTSEALAEECAQDVMATVWKKAHLFDPERASVATWVFTIARNRRIDMLRKQRRPEPEELPWGPEPEPDQADAMALQQESEKLVAALAELPRKQRELIERAYYGELSHTEIAAETGLPLGTIKSRIRLALERLRHKMS
jgi:RNA polymerase sigma factor (sigma-70 family)